MDPLLVVVLVLLLASFPLAVRLRRPSPLAPTPSWAMLSVPGSPVSVLSGSGLVEGVVTSSLDERTVAVALPGGASLPVPTSQLLPSLTHPLLPPPPPAPSVALPLPASASWSSPRVSSVLYGGRVVAGALVLSEVAPDDEYRVTVVTRTARRRTVLRCLCLRDPLGSLRALLSRRARVVSIYSSGRFVGQRWSSSDRGALLVARDLVAADR